MLPVMPRLLAFAALIALALPAGAEPVAYRLQPDISTVGFSYVLSGEVVNGQMPVSSAEVLLDFQAPENSRVVAVISAADADAGPVFADTAMKSADVLDTSRFPTIRFRSTQVTETAAGAVVDGQITIRDVTRPIRLNAEFYRQRGTEAGDFSRMSVVLRGAVSRAAFGASGYAGLVEDEIAITILARVSRIE